MQARHLALVAMLAISSGCRHISVSIGSEAVCREDVRASFGLVERNYAGYADKLAQLGAPAIERAQAEALRRVGAGESTSCAQILNDWLAVFDEGHMGVAEGRRSSRQARQEPEFEIVSDDVAWLRVPSFEPEYRPALEGLMRRHRHEIVARPELIIDVRGNGGGNGSTYRVLAELVYVKPVPMTGADVLATPENTAAWKRMLPTLHADERRFTQRVIARMQQHPGQWVNFFPDGQVARDVVLPQPSRVAVLTDAGCGSACERFVLEARQSPKVRVVGSATMGNLDYASLRPHPLPSGRMLWLGTTRAHGLPESSVDAHGIAPHIELDPALFDGSTRHAALGLLVHELRASLGRLVTAGRAQ